MFHISYFMIIFRVVVVVAICCALSPYHKLNLMTLFCLIILPARLVCLLLQFAQFAQFSAGWRTPNCPSIGHQSHRRSNACIRAVPVIVYAKIHFPLLCFYLFICCLGNRYTRLFLVLLFQFLNNYIICQPEYGVERL